MTGIQKPVWLMTLGAIVMLILQPIRVEARQCERCGDRDGTASSSCIVNGTTTVCHEKANFCFKTDRINKVGQRTVVRGCIKDSDSEILKLKLKPGKCDSSDDGEDGKRHLCICDFDNCNSNENLVASVGGLRGGSQLHLYSISLLVGLITSWVKK